MKRLTVLILAALMIFGLCACAGDPPRETEPAAAAAETPAVTESAAETGGSSSTEGSETAADPSPLLWRVTDADGHVLYLFGTCHVGDERCDVVFERVSGVLENCGALAVEVDVKAYSENLAQAAADLAQYALTDGSVVSDHLPEELYERSFELMDRAGLDPELYEPYDTALWEQMVEQALLTLYSDLDSEKGMEELLINFAYEREMPVLEIESPSFQMTLLNSFDNELYVILIEDLLEDEESYGVELEELYELWLSGDRDAFWRYLAREGEEEDAGKYTEEQIALIEDYDRKLLDDRNLGMRDRAVEYLESGQTVFFAVGAAHMANDIGLVKLLTDAGYTVEEISY